MRDKNIHLRRNHMCKYAFFFLLYFSSFNVYANIDDEINSMLDDGKQFVLYEDSVSGNTLISIGFGLHRKDNIAIDMAKQDAMKQLTGFLHGENVDAIEIAEQKFIGDQAEESFYQSMVSNINGTLSAAYLYKSGNHNDMKYVVMLISERSKDLSGSFSHRENSNTVKATAFSSLSQGIEKARKLALNQALRNAVEQFSGVQMASKTSIENAENYQGKLSSISKGVVKKYTVINEGPEDDMYVIEIVAEITEENDTSGSIDAIKESMGRPSFLIVVDDSDIRRMLSEVLNNADLEITDNELSAKYIIKVDIDRYEYPAIAGMTGMQTTITIKIKDKYSDDDFLNISNDPENSVELSKSDIVRKRNSYSYAMDEIKDKLTTAINKKFNSTFNNGSKVLVKLQRFDRMRDVDELKACIESLALTKSIIVRPVQNRSVTYEVIYQGNPSDLQIEILKKSREFRLRGLRVRNTDNGGLIFEF